MPASIGRIRQEVKRAPLEISAGSGNFRPIMRAPTLRDLLDAHGDTLQNVAKAARIGDRTLRVLAQGGARNPHARTVSGLSRALGVDPARVRAAIEGSWEAAQRK